MPKKHSAAVALGLIPALAAWGLLLIETALRKAGTSLFETAAKFSGDLYIHAYRLTPAGVQNHFDVNAAPEFALAYLGAALLLVVLHRYHRGHEGEYTGPVA